MSLEKQTKEQKIDVYKSGVNALFTPPLTENWIKQCPYKNTTDRCDHGHCWVTDNYPKPCSSRPETPQIPFTPFPWNPDDNIPNPWVRDTDGVPDSMAGPFGTKPWNPQGIEIPYNNWH